MNEEQTVRPIFHGEPVSPGIAMGQAHILDLDPKRVSEAHYQPGQEQESLGQWRSARDAVYQDLGIIREKLAGNQPEAEIMDVHQAILLDEEIGELVEAAIVEERAIAAYAVQMTFDRFIGIIRQLDDPLIAQREADLRDVRNRVLETLGYAQSVDLSSLPPSSIIVAHDLLPSDTASLDAENVAAIVTETGSSTSHSAILAKSLGIPAVLGVPKIVESLSTGAPLIVDAIEGLVITEPTGEQTATYTLKIADYRRKKEEVQSFLLNEAELRDGTRIFAGVNIGNVTSPEDFLGSDFIGLFRTEFLYMERPELPSEDEQFEVYRTILEQAGDRPVTLRTLDIGGDKDLPYLSLPKETNPFLGVRALRFCFEHPHILKTQFAAALRAAPYGQLKIMLPMVGSIDDVRRAKAILAETVDELSKRGVFFDDKVDLGIMIEVPSAAIFADRLACEVDFASIGTNDLCQYLFASDRMNPNMRSYYQMFSPAMLRTLKYAIRSFNEADKPISICGEMAGDAKAAILLVGLGLKYLSMNKTSLARVKKALRQVTLKDAEQLADKALSFNTQDEVLRYLDTQDL